MPDGFPAEFFGDLFGGKGKGKGGKGKMGGQSDDDDGDTDAGSGCTPSPEKHGDNSKLYELLGVEKDANAAEIKKAYRLMAMKHHPDKGGDPDMFKEIQRAFEVLSDAEKRELYDNFGEEGLSDDHPGSAQDLFGQLFGGKCGGGKGRRGGQRPRTKDQSRPMWVTLEEIYTGGTRPLPVIRKVLDGGSAATVPCQACDGDGHVVQMIQMGPIIQKVQQACPACNGQGCRAKMKPEKEVLDVFVEKGSPDGHKIVFHGKADEGVGHEPGDVIVVVKQREHPRFLRKGADLYLERDITLTEALTGFKLVVPHLDGRKLIVRSKPGEVLQPRHGGPCLKAVAGGGMPIHQDPFHFGNLFLVLTIRFPPALEPSVAKEIRRLLGAPQVEEEDLGDDTEEAIAEDIDPLESSKSHQKASTAAYDEDSDENGPGMRRMDCNQQ